VHRGRAREQARNGCSDHQGLHGLLHCHSSIDFRWTRPGATGKLGTLSEKPRAD
jgi:hypothetical protein